MVKNFGGASGYSKTPLIRKLGFDQAELVVVLNAPPAYVRWLSHNVPVVTTSLGRSPVSFVQWFVTSRADLEKKFSAIKSRLTPNGALWVCWPKKTSPLKKDVDERIIHNIGLQTGLVDVKVAAIDADWSGFKFVWRLKDRPLDH